MRELGGDRTSWEVLDGKVSGVPTVDLPVKRGRAPVGDGGVGHQGV